MLLLFILGSQTADNGGALEIVPFFLFTVQYMHHFLEIPPVLIYLLTLFISHIENNVQIIINELLHGHLITKYSQSSRHLRSDLRLILKDVLDPFMFNQFHCNVI